MANNREFQATIPVHGRLRSNVIVVGTLESADWAIKDFDNGRIRLCCDNGDVVYLPAEAIVKIQYS